MNPAKFDLVVIGGGPAGASGAAAGLIGKKVAVVEQFAQVGGAGINTDTIPSKTLRETALMLSDWRGDLYKHATYDGLLQRHKPGSN